MKDYDDRLGEFRWCENGIEKVITSIRFKKRYIKHYNIFCERCSNLDDIFPQGLYTTWDNFDKGVFPCLCSKACKLDDNQLINYLNITTPDKYKILKTNGLKGAQKRVEVYCSECAEDWELFPFAIFEVKVSHLKDGTVPCGCSKSYRYTDYEREVLGSRICERKGFSLKNVQDGKFIIYNPETGNEWSVPLSYMSSPDKHFNDPSLTSGKRSRSAERDISSLILEIFSKGSYHKETKFARTNKKAKVTSRSKYWKVTCGECKEVYYKTLANLKRGQKGCKCQPVGGFDTAKPAHLYIVRWYGFGKSYIKFGITNKSVQTRIKQQARKAKLDYEILHTFHHPSGQIVWDCERTIKQAMQTSVCPKELLPDGYTETVYDTQENLDKILNTILNFNLKEKPNEMV